MSSHCYNSGTGIDIVEYFSSNVEQLQKKDVLLESSINNLSITVSNLNPSNIDTVIQSLQNKDIEIDSNLTLLFTGYSNNSNSFSTLSNYVSTINADGSNYDPQILALQNKDISIDSNIISLQNGSNVFKYDIDILQDDYLQTSTDILNLQTKDDLLDTDIATINSTLTTLSNVDNDLATKINTNSNLIYSLTIETNSLLIGYSNNSNLIYDLSLIQITDRDNLNSGISNLSILSSNFTSNTTNFSADVINLNSGISNLSILSSNYAYITDIDSLNSAVSNESLSRSNLITGYSNNVIDISNLTNNLNNQISKEALDVSFLNSGYSNNLGLINTNITNITTISTNLTNISNKEILDVSFLNSGYSNNLSLINTNSNNIATQVAKEALDISFLNTGISNNITSISVVSNDLSTQVSKEALDVSVLNTGYSNNLGLITTNTNNISTQSTILTNQINKEALDVSFLNSGYSNNLSLINTNTTNITTLSNSLLSQITKEALDISFLNSGYSNNLTSINTNTTNITTLSNSLLTQINKEALDVSFLNTGYSNNYGLINTNTTNLTNQINKEALDVSFLNSGYSNNLGLINTNTSSISTLSTKQINDVSSLNAGVSNLSLGTSNLNNGISNLSVLSSNYATLTGTQTLTNKTLIDSTNNITANGLRTATTTVSISSATAPSSNQVLTAISASSAIWATIGGGSNYYLNDQPLGAIVDYVGSSAPTNWLLCFGQAISRTTYSDLYAIIGTAYGVGDGSTTFNLPDFRGRVGAGKDDMGGSTASRLTGATITGTTLGNSGGAETHTLTTAQMPSHNHNFLSGYFNGGSALVQHSWNNLSGGNFTAGTAADYRGTVIENTGGGGAHNNVQPTIIVNKIIKFTNSTTLVSVSNYTYTGTGNIMTGQSNSNNYIPYWSSNNSTFLTNGIDLATICSLTGIQTLTNKTLTDSTNNITANGLRTATTTVSISSATAPTSNQVLTAISASNAIWATPSSGGSGQYTYKISQITRSNIVNSNLERSYTTTSLLNLTNNTLTLVPLNLTTYDNNTNYNTSTYRFTAPLTGYYNICGTIGFTDLTSSQTQTGSIYKNTSNVLCSFIALNSTDITNISAPINELALLTAGDFIDLRAIQNTGGNSVDILGTTQDTNLSIYLLSHPSSAITNPTVSGSTFPLTMSNVYNPYMCRMYLSANTGALTLGTQYKVLFDVKNIDTNSNVTTSAYYAPVAGYYQVNYLVTIYTNASTGNYNSASIFVNGASVACVYGHTNASGKNQSYRCNDQLLLAVNDKVECYFVQNDYTGVNIVGGADLTNVNIHLVAYSTPVAGTNTTGTVNISSVYNTYLCKITKNASQTGMANGVWTTIQFNVKTYDLNTNFDITTYRYTAPMTGYYHCKAKIGIGGSVIANKRYGVGILKNNSTFVCVAYYQTHVTNELGMEVDDNVYLVAGDYIEVQFYNGSGSTQATVGFAYVQFMNFSVGFITSSVITPPSITFPNTYNFS